MDLKIAGKTPGVEIVMVALSRLFIALSIPWPPMAPLQAPKKSIKSKDLLLDSAVTIDADNGLRRIHLIFETCPGFEACPEVSLQCHVHHPC